MQFPELQFSSNFSTTKVRQLVEALNNAISRGDFIQGEALPSVNQISRQYNFSRDTVFKAYQELKLNGIIDSTPAKSYYVMNVMQRVLLILDVYSPYKDVLYNEFVNNLPKNYKVDLVFHFYNEHLFETVINDSLGRYNNYVIMNFNNEDLHPSLKKIDQGKLLLLDLGDFEKNDYPYISQDFGSSVYSCLTENLVLLKKYNNFVLHLPNESVHPNVLIRYFKKFLRDNKMNGEVVKILPEDHLADGTAYLIIQQEDLVEIVKQSRIKGFEIGKDIGLIAYNDMPIYEIIEKGITVISIDFAEMGKIAAEFVKSRQKVYKVIPARMVIRGSL